MGHGSRWSARPTRTFERNCLTGRAMAAFEYRQAREIRDDLKRHGIRYRSNRTEDRETLPRLRSFREYCNERQRDSITNL